MYIYIYIHIHVIASRVTFSRAGVPQRRAAPPVKPGPRKILLVLIAIITNGYYY